MSSSDESGAESQAPAACAGGAGVWQRLHRPQVAGLICTMIAAAVILLPRVVWAPMFGDPGEVQLTAAIGAVGHPPGQAGIISLLRVLCLVSPLEPYLTVCVVNASFALGVVAILTLVQLRSGVHPVIAGLCSLIFMADDQFWHAAITTETYATCFVLLAGSVWSFLSWLHGGRRWKLWVAVGLFAYLAVNRAPTVLFGAAFAAAIVCDGRARREWGSRTVRKLLLVAGIGLVSLVIMLASLWFRDVPGSGYNYLEQAGPSQPYYPSSNVSAGDRYERLKWLVTARQYDYMFHPSWRTLKGQSIWLMVELGRQHWPLMVISGAMVLLGAHQLWRRSRPVAVLVLMMIPAGVVPILLIRVVSHTTLLPNLLFALTWLLGLGLSRIFVWNGTAAWRVLVVTNVCFAVWWPADASFLQTEPEVDARKHIARVDLEELPPGATLIDFDVVPLVYVQQVRGIRRDVKILVPHGRMNRAYLESLAGPVFTTRPAHAAGLDADLVGAGKMWEIRLRGLTIED